VGNLCSAPILADRASGALRHQSSYWAIGHFARFIRPGARRVLCAASKQALECSAFLNPDGSLVAVVMNRSEEAQAFALRLGAREDVRAELPPRSIATFVAEG
jgi:glucosylceramidase